MKKFLCLCCFCLIIPSSHSQWKLDTTLPYGSHIPNIEQVCIIDSSVSWAMGIMHINQNYFSPYIARRTSNGWMQILNDLSDTLVASSITATDSMNVWFAATGFPQRIFFSSNGGINWTLQYQIPDSATQRIEIMFSSKFRNIGYAFLGYATGGNFSGVRILKTTNSGQNWNSWIFNLPGFYPAYGASICMVDSDYAWFGADSIAFQGGYSKNKIIKTTNGGINWQIIDVGPFWAGPESIQFSDDKNTGVFVGQNNTVSYIYRSTNGGFNWSPVYTMSYYYSETMRWVPGTSNIYGNSEYNLIRSTNNGINWAYMSGGPGTDLISMDAVRINDGTIYALAVTWNLQVYKLLDTVRPIGVKSSGMVVPDKFALYQNFPNPFNPITTIKYDIPKNSNVTMVVYDLLGREVTRLVNNEMKNAGRYEIKWNANNYASGVYIYRIQANDYVSVKKMVLVK